MQTTFTVSTQGQGLYDFTADVAAWVTGTGLLTLFVQHTSASLLIQENADRQVRDDLRNFFARLVPPATDPAMAYLTHTYEGPDDMPAHIKAALLPCRSPFPYLRAGWRWGRGRESICSSIGMPRIGARSQHT